MPAMPAIRPLRLAAFAAVIVTAVVVAYAGLGGRLSGEKVDPACVAAQSVARDIAPLARGEVAALKVSARPGLLPDLVIDTSGGATRTLADFRGRTILLNLWATWCAPCRHEMPALDKLQAELGGADFEVVAVNIDTRNLDKPKTWLKEAGIKRLNYYADPEAKIFQELRKLGKAVGMPTTLLVDGRGCELANLAGPAEWASEDALKLVKTALRR
jgi:thiol-disulfide isomerase/thioredoxin